MDGSNLEQSSFLPSESLQRIVSGNPAALQGSSTFQMMLVCESTCEVYAAKQELEMLLLVFIFKNLHSQHLNNHLIASILV